jgi:hypothetical protein
MTLEEIKDKINTEPDYIYSKRFDFSLKKLIDRYPEGAPNRVIAQVLQMTEEEVEVLYQQLLTKLREKIR